MHSLIFLILVMKMTAEKVNVRSSLGGCQDESGGEPDPSAVGAALKIKDHDLVDAYKRAAPFLLNDLARLLSQYR